MPTLLSKAASVLVRGAMLAACLAPAALADTTIKETKFDLDQVTCADYIAASKEDKDFFSVFLLGYMTGKSGGTELNFTTLDSVSAAAAQSCADDQSQTLVKAYEGAWP